MSSRPTDGGYSWKPITDGIFKLGSIAAIAVAPSNPNILYVGTGEPDMRGNASHGDGVWKSTDAGKTWTHIGLEDTQQISRIRVDPSNPDLVYVAAVGHMSGPNETRGVFRSKDGGKNWQKILYKSDHAGAGDLVIDPNNSNVLYASIWQFVRKPWTFESGGPDGGIWKSVDGGDNWKEIGRNPGLPKGVVGRIGLTVSPVNSDRVWALVEAEDGGVFRSDDGGATWRKVNDERILRQRAWYYTRDLRRPEERERAVCAEHELLPLDRRRQDLRRDPERARRQPRPVDLAGRSAAHDRVQRRRRERVGGRRQDLDPEAISPRASSIAWRLDNDFPYHIYGAQQDNTTVETASAGNAGSITPSDWHDVGGGESGWIAPDPKDSRFVYAGSYDGLLTRYDDKTGGRCATINRVAR